MANKPSAINILCLIPARAGSKSIPNKNIVDVGGKPLIQYSIDVGLELKNRSRVFDVVVSTDSQQIAVLCKELGANVPFLRPDHLSNDKAKSIDAILHALEWFPASDAVLLLQPTCPLRDPDVIEQAINTFTSADADALISAYKEEYICPEVSYNLNGTPFSNEHNLGGRRQDHTPYYVRNGNIYITRANYLVQERRVISERPILFEMSKRDSVNIDGPEDLSIVRALCK